MSDDLRAAAQRLSDHLFEIYDAHIDRKYPWEEDWKVLREALATPDRADILYKKGLRDTESKEGCAECERQERLLGADPTEEWVAEAWSQATPHPHFATPDRADLQTEFDNLEAEVAAESDETLLSDAEVQTIYAAFDKVNATEARTVEGRRAIVTPLYRAVIQARIDTARALATPDRADPPSWREASKRLHEAGDDEPYATDDATPDRADLGRDLDRLLGPWDADGQPAVPTPDRADPDGEKG